MFDPTITWGNIGEIATIIIGGITVMMKLNTNVVKLNANFSMLSTDMLSMQDEIKEMRKVLTAFAVADTKLSALTTRVENTEADIRDLRRGRGFIENAINREYP